MAYVVERNKRFTAYYRIDGKAKSVGTFNSRAKALQMALLAEAGEVQSLPEFQQTFNNYLEQLPARNDLRVITRKTYLTLLKKYAQPTLGARRITTIKKQDIKK